MDTNPDVQEIIHKLDDLPNFDHVASKLPLDPIGEFYDLIGHNYKVFQTQDKKTKN